jgi:hypothetical protein
MPKGIGGAAWSVIKSPMRADRIGWKPDPM